MEEKKEYVAPMLIEEIVHLEDIIALSNQNVLGEIFEDDGERFGG